MNKLQKLENPQTEAESGQNSRKKARRIAGNVKFSHRTLAFFRESPISQDLKALLFVEIQRELC